MKRTALDSWICGLEGVEVLTRDYLEKLQLSRLNALLRREKARNGFYSGLPEQLGSLDALAAHFYISKYHLCREFRKYTHNSIIEYLNFVRVIHAQRLFMETDKNVSEVAAAVGFASLTHFERIFTKMTGQKPLASRREIARAVEEKKTHRKEA